MEQWHLCKSGRCLTSPRDMVFVALEFARWREKTASSSLNQERKVGLRTLLVGGSLFFSHPPPAIFLHDGDNVETGTGKPWLSRKCFPNSLNFSLALGFSQLNCNSRIDNTCRRLVFCTQLDIFSLSLYNLDVYTGSRLVYHRHPTRHPRICSHTAHGVVFILDPRYTGRKILKMLVIRYSGGRLYVHMQASRMPDPGSWRITSQGIADQSGEQAQYTN